MPRAVPVTDVIAFRVPDDRIAVAEAVAAGGEMPDDFAKEINELASDLITRQYAGRPGLKAILFGHHDWLFTRDAAEVERFQPGDGCPECIAGNRAIAEALREDPTQLVALANVVYTEVWKS